MKFPDVLGQLPNKPKFDKHYWVDYIELLCLCNLDGELSQSDTQDKIRELAKDLNQGGEEEDNIGQIDKDNTISRAEKNDKWKLLIENWYNMLAYRTQTYKEFYPYILSLDRKVLKIHKKLTAKRKLYLYLLLSSSLNYVSKYNIKFKNRLSNGFEIISLKAINNCLPKGANSHLFGKNPLNNSKYSKGKLFDKLVKLSEDLKEELVAKENNFAPQDTGDGGIDIVAWIPFKDSESHKIIILGQCACTEEWDSKQFSTSYGKVKSVINVKPSNTNVTFIPFCFRDENGNWQRPQNVSSVLFDRQRLLFKIQNDVSFVKNLESMSIVDEIILQKEGVV
jgi:hypothetical protein